MPKIKITSCPVMQHGGAIEHISDNSFIFNGPSHDNGGIPITYAGNKAEVEGGETGFIDDNNSLVIMGNLINPLTGSTFKKDAKVIAKKEQKTQKFIDLGTELVNSTPQSKNKFELLKFNSGQAMLRGGLAKQKELAASKEHLSTLQTLMLEEHEPEKAEWGAKYEDGKKPDPRDKFETVRQKTQKQLEEDFPGQKVEIKYNEIGKERSSKQQSSIKSRQKSPLSQDWSTHNWDAGRDYNIFIDGKPAGELAYKVLHSIGQQEGLHFLKGNAGKNDPYHLSLVEEGKGNTASDLLKAYPEVANFDATKNWAKELNGNTAMSKNLNKAYSALNPQFTDNTPYIAPDLTIPSNQRIQGEGLYPNTDMWTPEQRLKINQVGQNLTTTTPQPKEPFKFYNPTNKSTPLETRFPWEQTAPLIPALTDTTDPVLLQQYSPDLYSPYQVSFQDQRNRNTAQLRATQQQTAYDPSAAGTLGAQAYSANEGIDANEFRTNQGIYNDVLNKNVNLLNDAKQKKLQLADQQYVRQEQAKGNTRDRRTEALVQLTDIVAKNEYENKLLGVTKNLYKDYSYDQNGQLQYTGPNAQEQVQNLPGFPAQPTRTETSTKVGNTTTKQTFQPFSPIAPLPKIYLKDYYKNPDFTRNKRKDGGKITQNKLSRLMYS